MNWRVTCEKDFLKNKDRLREVLEHGSVINSDMIQTVENGGIISFPHTLLKFSSEMILEVARSMYSADISRIIALGVLHADTLPPESSTRLESLFEQTYTDSYKEDFTEFKGAFYRAKDESAFGTLSRFEPPESWEIIRQNDHLLEDEFCLDYLFNIIELTADVIDEQPIPLLPIYCGVSFDPATDSFQLAEGLAAEINQLNNEDTALLATGNLVHFGNNYNEPKVIREKPKAIKELGPLFYDKIEEAFTAVFTEKDYLKGFDLLHNELQSDQGLLLPVLSELFSPYTVDYHFYKYRLSDYSEVWEVQKPSVVATSMYKLQATNSC